MLDAPVDVKICGFSVKIMHQSVDFAAVAGPDGNLRMVHPLLKTTNVQVVLTTGTGKNQVGTVTADGTFLFANDTLRYEKHPHPMQRGEVCVFPKLLSIWVQLDEFRGMRPAGSALLDVCALVRAGVHGATLELTGCIFAPDPAGFSETTPVALVIQPVAPEKWKQKMGSWLLAENCDRQLLVERMMSPEWVTQTLRTRCDLREQTKSNALQGMFGKVNCFLELNSMDVRKDMLGWADTVDPVQLDYLLDKLNMTEEMSLKYATSIVRNAVLVMAELCALTSPRDEHGVQTITIEKFADFADASVRKEEKLAEKLYVLHNELLLNVMGSFNNALEVYMNDETLKMNGGNIEASADVGEKMDLAGGRAQVSFVVLRQKFEENEKKIQALLDESNRLQAETPNCQAAVRRMSSQINALKGEQHVLFEEMKTTYGDCEDGTFKTVAELNLMRDHPDWLLKHISEFVGQSFMSVHMVFRGDGDVQARTQVLTKLVRNCVNFASKALKWQMQSVPGKIIRYKQAFGFASAPSMSSNATEEDAALHVKREKCDSFKQYFLRMYGNRDVGGHAFAVQETATPVEMVGDLAVCVSTVDIRRILESTVCVSHAGTEVAKLRAGDAPGPKNVTLERGGTRALLRSVSHAHARVVVGDAVKTALRDEAPNACSVAAATDLIVLHPKVMDKQDDAFYNVIAHVGAFQNVTGEVTSNFVTSTLSAEATVQKIHTQNTSQVCFNASRIAWEEDAFQTTSAMVSVPLDGVEESLLASIAREVAPVHVMTADQLRFHMRQMGNYVNVGFCNGEFTGTDYTGSLLDSDTKIAIHLVVRLSKAGASKEEFWNSEAGPRRFVQSRLQEALPDVSLRVKEIERGLFSVQAVVAVKKITTPTVPGWVN